MSIDKVLQLPFYAKITILLTGMFILLAMLFIAQGIIIPIVFAIIISIVLHPVVYFFVRMGANRVVAIVVTLFLSLLVIAGFGILLFSEGSRLSASWPILVNKFTAILENTITWYSNYFNIDQQNIHDWLSKSKSDFIDNSSSTVGHTLMNVGSKALIVLLIPVYIFMILFYQPLILEFMRRIFGVNNKNRVNEIISQTKVLIQRYIIGLLVEAIIVAALYAIGLLILGIDYAILLGCIAALLNIIPYIGGVIALCIIMIITIATKDSATYPLLVTALYIFIHFIDNSFIIPKIVASKVKINALVSITVIIAASALLGVPGMIICIPLTGIIKLIFDRIDSLKPWGFLLGDSMPLNK
jgi:predicted PurR-regulated permease PerM